MKQKIPSAIPNGSRIFAIVLMVFCATLTLLGQNNNKADDLLGNWMTPDNDGKIMFFRSSGKYYGSICWMKNPNDENGKPKIDKHNPDPSKRSQSFQGLIIFKDFEWNAAEGKYTGGSVYDARNGNSYDCYLKLIEHNVLEIHGYIGFSFIGKSEYFTR
jgi:uncharacterized protein (DUF2147 family)